MGGMSKDEKERMHLYTRILEYEQDAVIIVLKDCGALHYN